MYARVCVDVFTGTDDLFVYAVPEKYRDCIYIGSRVFVEFAYQKTLAYVIELTAEPGYDGPIKEIIEIIDFERGLTAEQIALAREIGAATRTPLAQCLRLMYPAFMQSRLRRNVKVIKEENLSAGLRELFRDGKKIPYTAELMPYYREIRAAVARGELEIETDIFTYGKRKIIKTYRLSAVTEPKSAKQRSVIAYLMEKGEATAEEIRENTGVSELVVNEMTKRGILAMVPAYPPSEATAARPVSVSFDFSESQLREKLRRLSGKPFLFHTDSEDFRLRFCLDAISEVISSGKKAMVVAPTLLSAAALEDYFQARLGSARISSFSSGISEGEFYYNFQNVCEGDVDLVIATPVGLFLPLADIALIIMMDTEHHNYINQQNPKFSALEVLKFRADYHGAKLILATAAPSIVSYYRYNQAEYFLLELLKRENVGSRSSMPAPSRRRCSFLPPCAGRLKRPGPTARSRCSCSISSATARPTSVITAGRSSNARVVNRVVYYKNENNYRCRYCNQQFPAVRCEQCGEASVRHLGYGLDKLEERFRFHYPDRRLYKATALTLQKRGDFEAFFLALEEGGIDAVIGTNILLDMISPEIGLIALINADALLYADDYRGAEMCYRLISKALDFSAAKTVVQGYNLDHRAITAAVNGDYLSFYQAEIIARGYALYPPFAEMNKITVSGEFKDIYYFANYFKKAFKRFDKGDCLGPVYVPKLRGVQLIVKHNDFELLSSLLDEVEKKFSDRKLRVSFERYPRFYE